MEAKFKVGDKVKFLDNLWEDKKIRALYGGLFGIPIAEDSKNEFVIKNSAIQDENEVEYTLNSYPWLVWEEELELINKLIDKGDSI